MVNSSVTTIMKKFTRIFFCKGLIITLFGCSSSIENSQHDIENTAVEQKEISLEDITVLVEYVDSGTYHKGGPGGELVHVHNLIARVKNVTKDTIFLSAWSCSKEDQFVVDDTVNYTIHPFMNCYSNHPTIETVLPDSSYLAPIMIKFDPKSKKSSFRIGFIHNRSPNSRYLKDKLVELGVSWSNELTP